MGTQQSRHGGRLIRGPLGGIVVAGSIFVYSCGGGGGDTNSPPGTSDNGGHFPPESAVSSGTENKDDGTTAPAGDLAGNGDMKGKAGNVASETGGSSVNADAGTVGKTGNGGSGGSTGVGSTGGKPVSTAAGGSGTGGVMNTGGKPVSTTTGSDGTELSDNPMLDMTKFCSKWDPSTEADVLTACKGYVQIGSACVAVNVTPVNPSVPMDAAPRKTWYLKFFDVMSTIVAQSPCNGLHLANADVPVQREEDVTYCTSCFNTAVSGTNASM